MDPKQTINLGHGRVVDVHVGDYVDVDASDLVVDGHRLTAASAEALAREIGRQHGLKRGRPPKSDADRASVQKAIRLTPPQARRLAKAAHDRGVAESAVIRDALDAYLAS